MLKDRSVFVIGAGASREAGLPTGAELKERIAKLVDIKFEHGFRQHSGDVDLFEALKLFALRRGERDVNPYLHAGRLIAAGMPLAISIDNFIEAHKENQKITLVGKLAIASAVLKEERASGLRHDPHENGRDLGNRLTTTWFNSFMQLLTESRTLPQLKERLSSLTLIIFNYDRCVEHYLHAALRVYYDVSSEAAAELLSRIEIFHPYGAVGELPWQTNQHGIPFGHEPSASELLDIAAEVKTFTEGTDPGASEIVSIRDQIAEARVVVFLGFGYHRINLDLLKPDTPLPDQTEARVYGTALKMSNHDRDLVIKDLTKLKRIEPQQCYVDTSATCRALFDQYWRGLSEL